MTRVGVLLGLALTLLGPNAPAVADHMRLVDPLRESRDLGIELKIGADHFKIAGRLTGPNGVASGSLDGRAGPDGLSLDGRLENEIGRVYTFRLDANLLGWLARRWSDRRSSAGSASAISSGCAPARLAGPSPLGSLGAQYLGEASEGRADAPVGAVEAPSYSLARRWSSVCGPVPSVSE